MRRHHHQNVTITVTGTNDTPHITSSRADRHDHRAVEQPTRARRTPDTATGAVTFTDVDLSDTHTVTVTGVVASGTTSGLPINSTVLSWLSLGALTDTTGTGLAAPTPGASRRRTAELRLSGGGRDRHAHLYGAGRRRPAGGITNADVTITVTGTNDTPQSPAARRPARSPNCRPASRTRPARRPPDTADRGGDLHRCRPQRYPHGDGDRRCRFGHHLRAADQSAPSSAGSRSAR